MKRERSARILATLGPASSTRERIRALAEAGADVFRLNFSHGSHEDHAERYRLIRAVEAELGRPIGVLMDLQGPKLRVGRFAEGKVALVPGAPLPPRPRRRRRRARRARHLPHKEIFAAHRGRRPRCCSTTASCA
jgi:pyruvate kinase